MNPTQKIAKLKEQFEELDAFQETLRKRVQEIEKQLCLNTGMMLVLLALSALAVYVSSRG